MKKITAVTVNYSRSDITLKLLESLDRSEKNGYILDAIVVDNSPQKSFNFTKKYDIDIQIIKPDGNTGFSGGNNFGIKEAIKRGADYIMLINDDTTIQPEMIIKLKEVLESDIKIGVVSPMIYFTKGREFHKNSYKEKDLGKVIWFAGGSMEWENAKSVHIGVDFVDHGQFDDVKSIDFATGCCMMIKKEVFEKVGFFDERYFLYYEDADLCQRISRAGFQIYFVPAAKMYHENASSSGGAGNQLHDYFLTRNQMLFGMKYAPLKTRIALTKQSLRLLASGRKYQKKGIQDYYLRKFGKGTYFGRE